MTLRAVLDITRLSAMTSGVWGQPGRAVVLTVCLDESGKFTGGHSRVAFGGWISDDVGWGAFQKDWKRYLAARGVSALHVGELLSHSAVYQGVSMSWDEKLNFLRAGLEISNRHALAYFGCAVDCAAFSAMSNESQHKCGGDAHMLCFNRTIGTVVELFTELDAAEDPSSHYPHPIGLIFDDNREYAVRCYQMLDAIKERNPIWKKRIGSICFVNDVLYEPLQAADALAWLFANRLKAATAPNPRHLLKLEDIDALLAIAIRGNQQVLGRAPLYDADELAALDAKLKGDG